LASCVAHWPNLQQLDLWGNSIGDQGIVTVVNSLTEHQCNIRMLALSWNKITDIACGQGVSKALRKCHALRQLDLSQNFIGDVGIEHLSKAFEALKRLEILMLKCNRIGDHGVCVLIPALKGCRYLQTLCLQGNVISEIGLTKLLDDNIVTRVDVDITWNRIPKYSPKLSKLEEIRGASAGRGRGSS